MYTYSACAIHVVTHAYYLCMLLLDKYICALVQYVLWGIGSISGKEDNNVKGRRVGRD
jgi:hypothetical protein